MADIFESIGDQKTPIKKKMRVPVPPDQSEPLQNATSPTKDLAVMSTKFKEEMMKLDQGFQVKIANRSLTNLSLTKYEADKYRANTEFWQKASEQLTCELSGACKHAMEAMQDLQLQRELTDAAKNEAEVARAETAKWKAECEAYRNANATLRANAEEAKRSSCAHDDSIRKLQSGIEQLMSKMESMRKQLKDLEGLYDQEVEEKALIVKQGEELSQECSELRKAGQRLKIELAAKTTQVQELQNELENIDARETELKRDVFAKQDLLTELKSDLDKKDFVIEKLKKQFTAKTKNLETLNTQLELKVGEAENLCSEIRTKNSMITTFKMDAENKEKLVSQLKKNLKAQKTAKAKLQAQLDAKKTDDDVINEAPELNLNSSLTAEEEKAGETDQSKNNVESAKDDRVARLETDVETQALEMAKLKLEIKKVQNEISTRDSPSSSPKQTRKSKPKMCAHM